MRTAFARTVAATDSASAWTAPLEANRADASQERPTSSTASEAIMYQGRFTDGSFPLAGVCLQVTLVINH
jgi:hypothetical protein